MKRIQESGALKLAAALLLLTASACSAFCGFRMLEGLPYVELESYQEAALFPRLLREQQNKIASGCITYLALEDNDGLTYAENQVLQDELDETVQSLSQEQTWFRFQIKTADGTRVIYSNLAEGESLEELVEQVHYAAFVPGEYISLSNLDYGHGVVNTAPNSQPMAEDSVDPVREELLVIECGVPDLVSLRNGTVQDDFVRLAEHFSRSQGNFEYWVRLLILCSGGALLLLLFLLWSAGHKAGVEGVFTTWQEKIFVEIYFCLAGAVVMVCVALMFYLGEYPILYQHIYFDQSYQSRLFAPAFGGLAACCIGTAALFLRTLTVRLKAGIMGRSSLICRLAAAVRRMICEIIRAMPFLWKVIITFLAFFFANSLLFNAGRSSVLMGFLWFVLNAAVLLVMCWWAVGFRRLQKGGEAMAEGNVDHQIDTRLLPGGLRSHAENLNNLSQGLAAAVDERIKSERFKAELITNVSHDLKTPLTSIINYVNLLKATKQTDPKALEYIEVLDRKSQRLKKLTEDLVEASKASTGVLSVSRERISAGQLLDQAIGEWSEKLETRNLSIITNLPEGETWVYADGRHLWRVLDNLLSNCSKYAMEGTRIYVDLIRGKGQVILSVKNISREPLNVPAERLMERFVRGEESRSSEGSGLGLSIARSLTELQGGTFELAVDGDLFKAVVTLPQAT